MNDDGERTAGPSGTRAKITASVRTYGAAIAAVAIAVAVRQSLEPLLGDQLPFLTMIAAVVFVAWYGGRGPALLAFGVGTIAVAYFVLKPRYSFAVAQVEYQFGLILYGFVCIVSIALFDSLRKARQRAEEKQRRLEAAIAVRQVTEKTLADREEELRITLASIGDAVITTDAHGNLTYLNAVAQQLTGWTQDECQGKPLSQVFHIVNEGTRQPVENPVDKVLREGRVVGLANHTILIDKDGAERAIDDSAAPIHDAHGRIVGVVLVFRDISNRRQAEEKIAENAQRFRLAAEAVNGIIYECDLQTGRVERTRGLYEVVGYRVDEVAPTAAWWIEQIHADDRERVAHVDPQIDRSRNAPIEYRVRHKDGRWLHVEDRAVMVRDGEGRPVKLVGCTVDVTGRKQAEEALRYQSDLLRSVTDNATTAIFMMDNESRCTFMNPAAEIMTGFLFEEVEGGILHDFIHHHHPDGRPYPMSECPIARALPELFDVINHEDVFIRKNAEFFPVMVNAKPIIKGGVAVGTVIEVRDITQEKESEKRITALLAELRDADRRKDEFLATLAHELRNPLAPVRNSLELMKQVGGNAELIEAARSTMERQISQMVRLIDDLMDVSRITRNKLELKRERIELASVVHHVVEANRPLYQTANHELHVTLPPEPIYLHADPTRLAQVFGNLLTNACKFTEPGGRVWFDVERQGSDVVVTVKDTGVGIPSDMLPKVFDMFTQVDTSLERSAGGLGIGLSLVRRLVELHDGTVTAHSEGQGRGSEFVVRLPILIEIPEAQVPLDMPSESFKRTARRILVVDDNRDSAMSLTMLLKLSGHEIHTAYDGLEAVEVAARIKPNVVLMDIGLPKLSGYEACRRIREQPWGKNVFLVALTGWGQEEDRQRSSEAGFNSHLVKPVEFHALTKLLLESRSTLSHENANGPVDG